MKITLIKGSSKREGQTDQIVSYLKDNMRKNHPDINVTTIDLSSDFLNMVNGELSVFFEGVASIDKSDSFLKLKMELMASDGIIIVSPVYLHHIPGVLKNFLDRMSNMAHFFGLHHKFFSVIVHANSNGVEQTSAYLEKIFSYMGAHHSHSFFFTNVEQPKNLENELQTINKKLILDIEKKEYPVHPMQNKLFNSLKVIVQNEKREGIQTYKQNYWKELKKYNSYEEFIKSVN